jgi:hypothetical protein
MASQPELKKTDMCGVDTEAKAAGAEEEKRTLRFQVTIHLPHEDIDVAYSTLAGVLICFRLNIPNFKGNGDNQIFNIMRDGVLMEQQLERIADGTGTYTMHVATGVNPNSQHTVIVTVTEVT